MNVKNLPFNRATLLLLCTIHLFVGCRSKTDHSGEAKSYSSNNSYYQHKIEVKHAKGFTIVYHDHFKTVHIISPFVKSSDTTKYILIERGSKTPEGYGDHKMIEIPVRTLAAMSSMHVGLLGFLDAYDILIGLGNLKYVYSPEVIKKIKAGKIKEVGKDQGLNEELLITMHPDLIMAMGGAGDEMSHYQTLNDAKIPVMINSEWVETTPLARAEWVKLLAALLNKEELVNQKFEYIEKEYERLTDLVKQVKTRPTIISGLNTKDVWFLPGAESYMTRFFGDAGAEYHWKNIKSEGSLSLSFESVYPIALGADYWMNVGFDSRDTKKTILATDSRYSDFKAFKSGRIYSYNHRVNDLGSNDFFESGNVNPQTVLADLIRIFHPELLPDYELVYYKKLE